jgi:hypothetical protein
MPDNEHTELTATNTGEDVRNRGRCTVRRSHEDEDELPEGIDDVLLRGTDELAVPVLFDVVLALLPRLAPTRSGLALRALARERERERVQSVITTRCVHAVGPSKVEKRSGLRHLP